MDAALVVSEFGVAGVGVRITRCQFGVPLLSFFELGLADSRVILARFDARFDRAIYQCFLFFFSTGSKDECRGAEKTELKVIGTVHYPHLLVSWSCLPR